VGEWMVGRARRAPAPAPGSDSPVPEEVLS
jgi:hypothetical protein